MSLPGLKAVDTDYCLQEPITLLLSDKGQCTHGKINMHSDMQDVCGGIVHSDMQEVCGGSRIVTALVLKFTGVQLLHYLSSECIC